MRKILVIVALCLVGFIALSPITHASFRLGTTEWPPFEYTENGVAKGSDVEILQAVFEVVNTPITIEFYPWSRTESLTMAGTLHGLFSLGKNQAREEWLVYPKHALNTSENVFFHQRGKSFTFETLEDLKGLTIGVTRGYNYGDEFMNSTLYTIQEANTDEQNFRMLQAGRIDLFICDKLVGVYILRGLGMDEEIAFLEQPLSVFRMYVAFSKQAKNAQELADLFDQGMEILQENGLYQEILNRYTN